MAAYTAAERDLPPSCDAGDTSVDAVVALYAPTDLAWGYDHPANARVADSPARLRAFLGGPPDANAERYRALSPSARVTSAAPRTLLVQGGRDQFVSPEHMERLAAQLRAHTASHSTRSSIPYAQHGFDFVVGGFSSQLLEAAAAPVPWSAHADGSGSLARLFERPRHGRRRARGAAQRAAAPC